MTNDNSGQDRGNESPRDRGILSQADREYLRGEKDFSSAQSERDARYRIRNRVRNALLDFALLESNLAEDDREQVFAGVDRWALAPVFAFLYKGLHDTADSYNDGDEFFERVAEFAIHEARFEIDPEHIIEDVTLDLDVTARPMELETIQGKLEAGDESMAELEHLLHHRTEEVRDTLDKRELFLRTFGHIHAEGYPEAAEFGDGEETRTLADYDDPEAFVDDYLAYLERDEE